MKYAKHGCENTKPTPYGDYAEPEETASGARPKPRPRAFFEFKL